jgi:hypothetical protein
MSCIIKSDFFNKNECKRIIKYAENKKKFLFKQKFNDIKKTQYYEENQITTSCYNKYNFFIDNPEFADRLAVLIKNNVHNISWPIGVQSWVNIYETDQGIGIHDHSGDISGNIFLGGILEPGINYIFKNQTFTMKNKIGEIQLFPSNTKHFVPPNKFKQKRYTIGMCIYQYSSLNDYILGGSCVNAKFKELALLKKPD